MKISAKVVDILCVLAIMYERLEDEGRITYDLSEVNNEKYEHYELTISGDKLFCRYNELNNSKIISVLSIPEFTVLELAGMVAQTIKYHKRSRKGTEEETP